MKKLIALMLMLCASAGLTAGERADALYLQITMTRGERSRDSNSTTTTLTISGNALVYEKTYHGRHGGAAPVRKEFRLNGEDQRKIVKLVKDRNLLRSDSIEREQNGSGIYFYFELSVEAVVDKSKGLISIKGSRKETALKDEKLYQDAVALIEEIYVIIHRTDKKVVYEPLI